MAVVALLALLVSQAEDARARAVREAYEEQLRRERPFKLSDEQSVVLTFESGADLATFDRAGAVSFLRVWIQADPLYPALIEGFRDLPLDVKIGRVRLLNRLSGRRAPLPTELDLDQVGNEWKNWLARRPAPPSDACAHDDEQVRRRLRDLSGDALEERAAAEAALTSCAGRHAKVLDEAIAATTEVEALARLRALRALADHPGLRKGDLDVLRAAVLLIDRALYAEGVALLRTERERFQGPHRETVDLLLKALERRP